MVNAPSQTAAPDRRERPRASAAHAPALGAASINPFGDLVTLQHLSARLAKSLKPIFEGLTHQKLRSWAEPLSVERLADYKAERPEGLTAWQPIMIGAARQRGFIVIDGGFVFEMLDCFFGGDGEAPNPLPKEFTLSAESLVARLGRAIAAPMTAAWEPVTPIDFAAVSEGNVAMAPEAGSEDPVVVTRFGFACGDQKPVFVDILYPVAALKPHTASLTGKVHDKTVEVEPQWRSSLTRAVMGVRLPVRSVLAEPVIDLGRLLELKAGDVIAIDFGPEVPVMVAGQRLGTGLVGTANGRAAVRMTSLEPLNPEDLK